MPKITGANVSSFSVADSTATDTSAVTAGTDTSEDIATIEWGTDPRRLDVTGLGNEFVQNERGKKDSSLTLSVFSQDSGGTINALKSSGAWDDGLKAIHCQYGGDSGNDKTLQFIGLIGPTRTSIDADGNLITNITFWNKGDQGVLDS